MELVDSAYIIKVLGISRKTLYRMLKDGRFPQPHGTGKMRRWQKAELDTYLRIYTSSTLDECLERFDEIYDCAKRNSKCRSSRIKKQIMEKA